MLVTKFASHDRSCAGLCLSKGQTYSAHCSTASCQGMLWIYLQEDGALDAHSLPQSTSPPSTPRSPGRGTPC